MLAIINNDNYYGRRHSYRYFHQNNNYNNLRNNHYPQLPSLQALSPRKYNHTKFSLPSAETPLPPVISKVSSEPSVPSQTTNSLSNFIPSQKPSTIKIKSKHLTNKVSVRFNKYHHYDEMVKLLKNMAKKNPNITRLYSIGKSLQGRDLWVMQLSE